MYAVIQSGGKQYRVAPGEDVKVEKLPGEVGDPIAFEKVLLTSDGENVNSKAVSGKHQGFGTYCESR